MGEELLRAFHDSDDPAPLTELLRLFSAVALTKTAAATNEDSAAAPAAAAATGHGDEKPASSEEPTAPSRAGEAAEAAPEADVTGAVGLVLGLAERETLERLAFFLENSLEERLLAWVSFGVFSSSSLWGPLATS